MIHFRRILPLNAPAAVPPHAAVAVHDDLAPGQLVSPCGPPTTKRLVGFTRNCVFFVEQMRGQNFLDDFLDDGEIPHFVLHVIKAVETTTLVMRMGLVVFILDGDPALRVGPEPADTAGFADAGQFTAKQAAT